MRALKYLLGLIPLVSIYFAQFSYGWFCWLGILVAFILIPGLELFIKPDPANVDKAEEELRRKDNLYDYVIYAMFPLQYILLIVFLFQIGEEGLSLFEQIGRTMSFGVACGVIGINVAHELGHRRKKFEIVMAKLLLLSSQYMHFIIEHNRGHHKNVSTDLDPASAKKWEPVYFFWVRSIVMSYFSAWKLEADLLKKNEHAFFSIHNEMIRFTIIQTAMLVLIGFFFGIPVLGFYLTAATVGVLLLETVNYIEHYGLRREKIGKNRYEKTTPAHSWNSDHLVGRLVLFELTRHSDHHYMAGRKYQLLRHFDNSPQLPTGYPGMMVLSLIPPLWFYIVHKRIDKFKTKQFAINA